MAETSHQAHPDQHPERHEHKDIYVRPLAIFGIVFVILAIVFHVGLYYLYGLYTALPSENWKDLPRSAVPSELAVPEPRIQGIPGFHPNVPVTDMEQLQAVYTTVLNTYGPGDEPGYVRIPLERAMELLLKRGLPATQPTTQPSAAPTGQR